MPLVQTAIHQTVITATLVLFLTATVLSQDHTVGSDSDVASKPGPVFVVILDNGEELAADLVTPTLELETRYGSLAIPSADLRRIDFAVRVSPEMTLQIQQLIGRLNSKKFSERENAAHALKALGKKSFPELRRNKAHEDPETQRQVNDLLKTLKKSAPGIKDYDVVFTTTSEIAGTIRNDRLVLCTSKSGDIESGEKSGNVEYDTSQFEKIITPEELIAARKKQATPAPKTVMGIHHRIDEVFEYRVTGAMGATVWGSGPYTSDSAIATAAIHAGLVSEGETVVIRLKIVRPPATFAGTSANGVITSDYGAFEGAYEFVTDEE